MCRCEDGLGCTANMGIPDGCHHNVHWQAAAYAIEVADHFWEDVDGVLGLNLDLTRNVCMAFDVYAGFDLPNAAELRRVGLDIVEIWKVLGDCRQSSVWNVKVERGFLKSNRCVRGSWDAEIVGVPL